MRSISFSLIAAMSFYAATDASAAREFPRLQIVMAIICALSFIAACISAIAGV